MFSPTFLIVTTNPASIYYIYISIYVSMCLCYLYQKLFLLSAYLYYDSRYTPLRSIDLKYTKPSDGNTTATTAAANFFLMKKELNESLQSFLLSLSLSSISLPPLSDWSFSDGNRFCSFLFFRFLIFVMWWKEQTKKKYSTQKRLINGNESFVLSQWFQWLDMTVRPSVAWLWFWLD